MAHFTPTVKLRRTRGPHLVQPGGALRGAPLRRDPGRRDAATPDDADRRPLLSRARELLGPGELLQDRPPLETVTLGAEVPDALRQRTKRVRWKWRAQVLPKGGNECKGGFGDSAAVIYVSWKSGLKWYSIKYVWSSEAEKGRICDQKRNLFVVQDTVILETGGPVGEWREEEIDPSTEFRAHFEGGNPNADVPDLVGVGLMSDGDQTKSISAADYTGFELRY
ncbi:MAG: DUF3047 domain-containing protein [Deltaproteobacteria bacterium]|nr:MAG: DUF3047 domain-containing protein [Deltaproteobacteria bacterium]